MPDYPNVPIAPGVPPLLRDPTAPISLPVLLTADLFSGYGYNLPPQWGIYLGGAPVVVAESAVGFSYKQDWAIADYPVERGGFESYDKVNTPFTARVQLAASGSAGIAALLASLGAIGNSLVLIDAVTPEMVYSSVNVSHYDYRRTARNGVGLLVVDVWLTEIRISDALNFQSTQSPSGASPVSGGNVQPSVWDTGAPPVWMPRIT